MKTTADIIKFSTEKEYQIPSGLGGVFSLKFLKYEKGIYYFNITTPDFEREIKLTQLTINQVEEYN